MTISITPIDLNSNTWGDLINRLNQLINASSNNYVTSGGNATGGTVVLSGTLDANVANILTANVNSLTVNTAAFDTLTANTVTAISGVYEDLATAGKWQIGVDSGGLSIKNLTSNTNTINMKFSTNGSLAVGTNLGEGFSNHPSVVFGIESTSQGFRPPRMTTAQRNAISNPATGIVVYDTTLNQLFIRNNNAWAALMDSATNPYADMNRNTYDPEGINGDAFSFANFTKLNTIAISSNTDVKHLYAETATGTKQRILATTTANTGTVALRGAGGSIVAGAPTANNHATTKLYVDNLGATKANVNTNIIAGSGLTGGGPLSSNVTISLSSNTISSLAKADTAVQPEDLGNAATRNVGTTSGTVAAGDDPRIVNAANTTTVNQAIANATANLVSGPSSATSGHVAVFDTNSKTIASGGYSIADLRNRANHTGVQPISTIDGLQSALDGKQAVLGYTPVKKSGDTNIGGMASALEDGGNTSGKTIVPSPGSSNFKMLTMNGNWTLKAPTTNTQFSCVYYVKGSTGTLTTSGWSKVHGAIKSGKNHFIYVTCVSNGYVLTIVEAS